MEVTEIVSGNHIHQFLMKNGSGDPTVLGMKSSEGTRKITKFRYFRLYITQTSGDSTLQFTKLKFVSNSGKIFNYWNGTEEKSTITNYVKCTYNRGSWGAEDGERGEYGLLTDPKNGKCCFLGETTSTSANPAILTYDLYSERLDIAVYKKWYWYTANDTSGNTGRNMVLFKLQVSNDATNWITVDENTDPANIKTTADWSLAYEHDLDLSNL